MTRTESIFAGYRKAKYGLVRLQELVALMETEQAQEIASLRAFKAGVDEALNSGDGTYRP